MRPADTNHGPRDKATTPSRGQISHPEEHDNATSQKPAASAELQHHPEVSPVSQPEPGSDSVNEVNKQTQGTEYYGPTGVFSFLSRLRSKAGGQHSHTRGQGLEEGASMRPLVPLSIVNFLHSPEYEADYAPEPLLHDQVSQQGHAETIAATSVKRRQDGSDLGALQAWSPVIVPSDNDGHHFLLDSEIEKTCARLFFENLHLVHPVLQEAEFLARCRSEFWSGRTQQQASVTTANRSFYALFCAVIALGAITAGEASIPELPSLDGRTTSRIPPTLKLADIYFRRAKASLGDIFETCSLQSTQTLFLMSVFCQNALKPHSCYMFSGMAIRTALAMGLPNDINQKSRQESDLWWAMYSHEIEMCTSAGREPSLRQPSGYEWRPAVQPHLHDMAQDIVRLMVPLAHILKQLAEDVYPDRTDPDTNGASIKSLELDSRLEGWKAGLPLSWDLKHQSLTEPEWMTKQKTVLELRFLNAKILLHRPFLIAATTGSDPGIHASHVKTCIDASRKTIDVLYVAYMHRPYFRTWWYNTTYLLYASMILLYAVLSNIQAESWQELLEDVDKSLEILRVMDKITIAQRCAQITAEVLETARRLVQHRHNPYPGAPSLLTQGISESGLLPGTTSAFPDIASLLPNGSELDFSQDDMFAGLLDFNLMGELAGYEDLFAETPFG